ncbi:MAG TPA: B12-binding domain-containing protein [Phycisphaerae bacterium]|nr:B12-binding domain-containing protein [Phycisphaerae bacterium]
MPAVETLLEKFVAPLFAGDRSGARAIVAEAFEEGLTAEEIIMQLIWPTMEKVQGMYRSDRINTGTHHMASRLLRMLADQLALRLPRSERNGRTMLVVCSPGEPEELGAQITTDLAEAHGWSVHFAGGGVPNDEIVGWIGQLQPQVLMVYGTIPSATPMVRQLIDLLHDVGICPKLQIICSGGVFNRAEGLSEEIGSDLFAPDPVSALEILQAYPGKRATPEQQTVGRKRRVKKAPPHSAAKAE